MSTTPAFEAKPSSTADLLRERERPSTSPATSSGTGASRKTRESVSRDSQKDFLSNIRDRIRGNAPTELTASYPSVAQRLDGYVPFHRSLESTSLRPDSSFSTQIEIDSRTVRSAPMSNIRTYWKNPHDIQSTVGRVYGKDESEHADNTLSSSRDKSEAEKLAIAPEKMLRAQERILVVGQDVFSGGVVSAVLTHSGYHVVVTSTGKEAQTLIQEQTTVFTVVLVQSTIPDMKAQEFIPYVRITLGRDVPLGVIVGNPSQTGMEQCIELGADDVIFPPFNHHLTKQRIDTLVTFFWLRKRVEVLTQDCKLLCSENEALYKANITMQQRISFLEHYLSEQKHIMYENVLIRTQQEEVIAERENSKMMAHALIEKTKESINYQRQLMVMQDRAEFFERQLLELSPQKGFSSNRAEIDEETDEDDEDSDRKSAKSDRSITISFPSNAPDWVFLFSTSPHFKLVSLSKFIKDQIEHKSTEVNRPLDRSPAEKNIATLIQSISETVSEWNSDGIISIETPKSKHNQLLREWLEYTFGKADNKLVTHKINSESKADLMPLLDSMSVSTNETKKDTFDGKSEDTIVRRRTSTVVRRKSSMSVGHASEARRSFRGSSISASPAIGRIHISSFLFTYPNRREWNAEAKHVFEHSLTADVRAMSESLRFDSWRLPDRVQLPLALHFFTHFDLLERFFINVETMQAFILALRDTSGTGSFHNFTRSVDIAQAIFFILLSSSIAEYVTELDILCLLIVSLSSSLEHPGFTNRYLERSRHHFYLLHGNQSTIEKHMHRVLHTILSCPELNIFSRMSESQVTDAFETMSILFQSMDLQVSFSTIIAKLAARVSNFDHISFPLKEKERAIGMERPPSYADRMVLSAAVLHLAMNMFLCRPAYIMYKWKDLFMEELNAQGALEKASNIPATPFAITRTEDEISPILCINMCDYIISPIIHYLRIMFTGLDMPTTVLTRNRNSWSQDIMKKVLQDQSRPRLSPPKTIAPSSAHLTNTPTSTTGRDSPSSTIPESANPVPHSYIYDRYKEDDDAFHFIPDCVREIVKARTARHFDPNGGPTSLQCPEVNIDLPENISPLDYPPALPSFPTHPLGSAFTSTHVPPQRYATPSLSIQSSSMPSPYQTVNGTTTQGSSKGLPPIHMRKPEQKVQSPHANPQQAPQSPKLSTTPSRKTRSGGG